MSEWVVVGRHKWVEGAVISESHNERKSKEAAYRRFTATIRGFRNWKILEGYCGSFSTKTIVEKVKEIRDRIDSGDESVFYGRTYEMPKLQHKVHNSTDEGQKHSPTCCSERKGGYKGL